MWLSVNGYAQQEISAEQYTEKKWQLQDGSREEDIMNRIDRLYMEMIHYYQGDPKHIQHFVKVHDLSRLIGQGEGLDEDTMYVLEAAALVHDIGIKVGMEKYGRSDGKTQEAEGPAAAREMLTALGFQERVIRRVEYLVGHHHTYKDIDGLDYQILRISLA